jgi:hypothetical protein
MNKREIKTKKEKRNEPFFPCEMVEENELFTMTIPLQKKPIVIHQNKICYVWP